MAFLLYSFLDYITHAADFYYNESLQIKPLLQFYSALFLKRADILLPLSLLLSVLQVVLASHRHKEWLRLKLQTLPNAHLFKPFLLFASLACLFNLANAEYGLAWAHMSMENFYKKTTSQSSQNKNIVFHRTLPDHSTLIWGEESENGELKDLFWVHSLDEIWKMDKLCPANPFALATHVDILKRDSQGNLIKTISYPHLALTSHDSSFFFSSTPLFSSVEYLKLSELFQLYFSKEAKKNPFSYPEAMKGYTLLFSRLCFSLLPLLVVIGILPWALPSERSYNYFFIYLGAVFGFLFLYLFLEACALLGERALCSPLYCLFIPFTLCAILLLWPFIRKAPQ